MTDMAAAQPTCPCGAGNPYQACCGRTAASEEGRREEPPHIRALYADAQGAATEGRFIHALTAVREILEAVPLHYGAARLALAIPDPVQVLDADTLEDIITRGLAAYPDDFDMQCDAAEARLALAQPERAEQLLRGVLQDSPHHLRAHAGLGRLARRRQQLDLAEYHFRQACYQQQFAPRILNELGGVLSALGRKHEAEHYFRIALAQAPGDAATLLNWCRMEESRGDLERAWRLLALARESAPRDPGIQISEALLQRRQGNHKQAILTLDGVEPEALDAAGRAALDFERCVTLDQMGLYDQAFEAGARANAIKEGALGSRYDADQHEAGAGRLKKAFTATRLKSLDKGRPLTDKEERPVFICGFTRSGTSMVEQILSAHSRICGGDELPFIYDLANNAQRLVGSDAPFPDCLFERPAPGRPAPLQVLRQRYLARLRLTSILEPGVRRFTDKMPMNELHLGLIHGLFPEARIIHVVRHPLDSVLSTFFTDATHGGNCGYKLESAARHYRLLFEMTEHYRKKSGIELLRVRYEDLVRDIREQTARMLEYIGEGFEEACLDFHLNPRFSRTASYAQVTRPLYDSSVHRYRHYRKHLEPVIPELEPAIKRLRYVI